jgi:hypothetical protein
MRTITNFAAVLDQREFFERASQSQQEWLLRTAIELLR